MRINLIGDSRQRSVAAVLVALGICVLLTLWLWPRQRESSPAVVEGSHAVSDASPGPNGLDGAPHRLIETVVDEAHSTGTNEGGSSHSYASRELRQWLAGVEIESYRHRTGSNEAASDDDVEAVDIEEGIVQWPGLDHAIAVRQVLADRGGERRVLQRDAFVADRVLVKLRRPGALAELRRLANEHGATIERRIGRLGGDLYAVRLQRRGYDAVAQAVAHFTDAAAGLAYAEPDHLFMAIGDGVAPMATTPDDPDLSECWGLDNTGQTGGTADADIDAPEAWDLATGSPEVIVAVIDTGIDYNHPDLAANMWSNPGEIPDNHIDDDNNGYVDDVHGFNFVGNTGDPMDDNLHGTHCAGTIGAVGSDGNGISGVCWSVKLMAVKFLSAEGAGIASGAVSAIEYAIANGAHVTSNSWGGGAASQALEDVIKAAHQADVLFVAAAGNSGSDNDVTPVYPGSYEVPNVIAVAASDHNDEPASFTCYGTESVDLFAPGVNIYSTFPTYKTNTMKDRGFSTDYESISGTSMATPHVAGAAALLSSVTGRLSPAVIKSILMESVDPIDNFSGLVASGGRLNVANMLQKVSDAWLLLPTAPMWHDGPDEPAVGNGNAFAEAGETLAFSFEVANIGLEATQAIAQAQLTASDPFVSVSGGSVDLGIIDGLERRAIDGIIMAVDPSTPSGHVIECQLNLQVDQVTVDSRDFSITVYKLGTLSGHVYDHLGNGVSGFQVRATATAEIRFSTYTDGDGYYEIPVLEGYPMELTVVKRAWLPDAARFTAPSEAIDLHVRPLDFRIIDKGVPFGLDRFGHAAYEVENPAQVGRPLWSLRETCEGDRLLPFQSDGGWMIINDLLSVWAPTNPDKNIWRDGVMDEIVSSLRAYHFTNDEVGYGYSRRDGTSYPARWDATNGVQWLSDTPGAVYAIDATGRLYGTLSPGEDIKPWIGGASGDILLDLPEPEFANAGVIQDASQSGTQLCGIMYRDERVATTSAVGFHGTPEGIIPCNYPITYEEGDDFWSRALCVNDEGLVGGWFYHIKHNAQTRVAGIYRGGSWIDLNDIMPAHTGWVLQEVVDINESGEIICRAQLRFKRNFSSQSISGTVIISPRDIPNRTPLADAGADQRVLLELGATLHAQANDDGEIAPDYLWEQVDGPAPASIAVANARGTAVGFSAVGSYRFRFSAVDADGATAVDEVQVEVVDEANQPPTIAITAPNDGTRLELGVNSRLALADIEVTTADADGEVARVEYRVDGITEQQNSLEPFVSTLRFDQVGTYSVVARAYDDDGASADSDPVELVVAGSNPIVEILYPVGDVAIDFSETIVAQLRLTRSDAKLRRVDLYVDDNQYTQWYPPADEVLEFPLEGLDTGTHSLRASVTDEDSRDGQDIVVFDIVRPPFITAPADLENMLVDSYRGISFEAFGSVPLTWSLAEGDLPPGMVLDDESGAFSGSVPRAGSWTFTIQVDNIHGTHQRTFTQKVLRVSYSRSIRLTAPDADWSIEPEDGLPAWEEGDSRIFDQVDPTIDHIFTATPTEPTGDG